MRRLAEQRLPIEPDGAAVRRVQPAQAIEQSGFSGAVGADQADDGAGRYIKRNTIERDNAAKADHHILDFEQRRDRVRARRRICHGRRHHPLTSRPPVCAHRATGRFSRFMSPPVTGAS